MKINLIWVGRTKERFINDGIDKYLKLIKPYADVSITEIKEEKGRDIDAMVEREGSRIVKLKVPYVLMDEKGKRFSSVEFADFTRGQTGGLNLVLGGAYGVSETVKKGARETVSLSRMTFTHEMSRLFLLEQLFRAFSIINKRGYHH
ncbi:MAG: 23S rRNA (pseudouridine(1915)-N(3))-methyltransferase RlmH [Nitrospirae bacterium]|nr:23S rRNA (pseudouridine(1915)-N(3))-methyltransferase RlmH [Nitrospirota bacterium]